MQKKKDYSQSIEWFSLASIEHWANYESWKPVSKFIYHVPPVASNEEQLAKFQQFGKPARAILWGYKGKVDFSFGVESSSGELNNVEIKKSRI